TCAGGGKSTPALGQRAGTAETCGRNIRAVRDFSVCRRCACPFRAGLPAVGGTWNTPAVSKSIQRGLPSAFLLAASLCTSFYAAAQDAPRGWARLDARAGAGVAVSGDATAAHYNPAALAQLEQDVAFDVGLSLEATQRTTGSSSTAGSVAAAWDVHPAPLLAAAWRPTPILAVGLAAGLGLVSGARFESPDELDVFSLTLYEVTPTLSVRLPPEWGFGSWALGLGYRLSFGQTTRERTQ